ncbi:hypothetical protein LX73_1627 [Fodinibius salinus]|uniref:Uncharacterized protein n=1 Tax=Fodinibius salinus TaxID=860790 RepID=A0A5D3YMK0_9BACT|nr:hypothetical protein [Fodinibius salinus]TYP93911.1 hypothetical protein LX73_1627 [Fodinibius salinus]
MEASLKAFMKEIIDYAGLFPPSDLSLDPAIKNYSKYRSCEDRWMLSRFIIPALDLDQLAPYGDTLFKKADNPYSFSVLGKGTETMSEFEDHLQQITAAVNQFHDTHGSSVRTDMLEIKLPREVVFANDADLFADAYTLAVQELSKSSLTPNRLFFEGYFEKNWKKDISLLLDTMQSSNESIDTDHVDSIGYKLRCGGIEADMFPSVQQVSFALTEARKNNVALKATAGLHHPVRHYADSVQTKMHGFLNVFGGAMLGYAHDLSASELSEIISEEDPEQFIFTDDGFEWNDLHISTDDINELREVALISYGSCSFDEPREDLQNLGLMS